MIRDGFLKFAENTRPGVFTGAAVNDSFIPFATGYPLLGGIAQPIDLMTAMDLGQGNALSVRFQVHENFACADAAVRIRWAVGVADDADGGAVNLPGYTSNFMLLAQSLTFAVGSLALTGAGFHPIYNLTLPPISRIHVTGGPVVGSTHLYGRRYLYAGMVIESSVLTPGVSQCFTAGLADAHLMLNAPADNEFRPVGFGASGGAL